MLVVKEVDTDGLMFDGQPFSTLGPQWKAFPGNSSLGVIEYLLLLVAQTLTKTRTDWLRLTSSFSQSYDKR